MDICLFKPGDRVTWHALMSNATDWAETYPALVVSVGVHAVRIQQKESHWFPEFLWVLPESLTKVMEVIPISPTILGFLGDPLHPGEYKGPERRATEREGGKDDGSTASNQG